MPEQTTVAPASHGIKMEASKGKRQRSPAYPFISLKTAVERAKEFYDKEKRNASNISVAVTHWGYAPKSSGGVQTIAALKSFGLMRDTGSGEVRSVQLTDEALRILLDQREDSSERNALIKNAALLPTIHSILWKRWGATNMPSDANLRHELLFTYKFNEDAIDGFIRQYKATVAYAKLGEKDALTTRAEHGEEEADPQSEVQSYIPSIGDFVQWEQGGILQFREPRQITRISTDGRFAFVEGSNTGLPIGELTKEAKPIPAMQLKRESIATHTPKAIMREDVFSLAEGSVTFQWPTPLSVDSVQDLKDWLKILERKVSRSVRIEEDIDESSKRTD